MNKLELIESLKKKGFHARILEAFEKTKREDFILPNMRALAYSDIALPIGSNQTISQPHTIAVMLSLLKLKKGQKVLEVGSGSGYVLALISEIVGDTGTVFGLEIVQQIAEKSKSVLRKFHNIEIFNRDAKNGLPQKAPFDRILISAACKDISSLLIEQLKEEGILVVPLGESEQSLTSFRKQNSSLHKTAEIPGFVFVKFI